MQTKLNQLKKHPRFYELINMRSSIKSIDCQYAQRLVSGRYFDLDKEIFVSANYEYNHNIDFELTKNDIRDIKNGRLSNELLHKIELDLSMLDNNPKYYKFDDREVISYDIDIPKDQEFYTDSLYDDLRALISKAMIFTCNYL